ncbi:MAG: hypothetical protein ACO1OB_07790 [Archangium sp.]
MAKAVLTARSSNHEDAESVAALWVKRATALTDSRLSEFMSEVAPEQSWLLFDSEGRVFSHVKSAPELGRSVPSNGLSAPRLPVTRASFFTDVHQWLLKALLAPHLNPKLLNAPRGPFRNATALADATAVSLPTVTRFLHGLDEVGFLDRSFGDLRVARPLDLLQLWRDRVARTQRSEVGAVFPRLNGTELELGVFAMTVAVTTPSSFALASHAACNRLGLRHVDGFVPAVWVASFEPRFLEKLGVVVDDTATPHVLLRVPRFPRSTFNAAVDGASDVIQCWLDTSHERVRGREQADYLWRTVLRPAFT